MVLTLLFLPPKEIELVFRLIGRLEMGEFTHQLIDMKGYIYGTQN